MLSEQLFGPDLHEANAFRTPSVVHIGPDGCLVGQLVEDLLEDETALTVARFFKLRMGTADGCYADQLDREWKTEAPSALVLGKLLKDAEAFAYGDFGGMIVAVPAQFDNARRHGSVGASDLLALLANWGACP